MSGAGLRVCDRSFIRGETSDTDVALSEAKGLDPDPSLSMTSVSHR